MNHVFGLILVTAFAVGIYAALQRVYPRREWALVQASWALHYVTGYANLAAVYLIFGHGDMQAFHRTGVNLAEAFRAEPWAMAPELVKLFFQQPVHLSIALHGSSSTGTMYTLATLGCLISFDSLWAISLLFTMLSFLGKVAMYHAIRERLNVAHRWYVGVGMLLIPSYVYWTAGLIKESVVVSALGASALGMHLVLGRRQFGVVPLVCGVVLIALVKAYVLLVLSLAGGVYWYWQRAVSRGRVEIRPISLLVGMGLGLGGVLLVGELFPRFALSNLADEAASLQIRAVKGGSAFSLGGGDASLSRQLTIAPLALLTAFYRPLLIESQNVQMVVNSLETTAFLLLSLRLVVYLRFKAFVGLLVRDPFLVFCLVFALVMGLGVGLATGNLGTLSRYRAPLMPFLAIFLVICNFGVTGRRTAARPAPRPGLVRGAV